MTTSMVSAVVSDFVYNQSQQRIVPQDNYDLRFTVMIWWDSIESYIQIDNRQYFPFVLYDTHQKIRCFRDFYRDLKFNNPFDLYDIKGEILTIIMKYNGLLHFDLHSHIDPSTLYIDIFTLSLRPFPEFLLLKRNKSII